MTNARRIGALSGGGTAAWVAVATLLCAGCAGSGSDEAEAARSPDAATGGGVAEVAAAASTGEAGPSTATNAGGAGTISEACAGEERRQFDFWLGRWTVVNPAGDTVGMNEIRRVASGCGLLESWRGRGGNRGTSLNLYDPRAGRWEQHWAGGGGLVLHLSGGLRDGSMVLSGSPRPTRQGPTVTDRITWTPRDAGRVRQRWQVSEDGGESWRTVFDGTYLPTIGDLP